MTRDGYLNGFFAGDFLVAAPYSHQLAFFYFHGTDPVKPDASAMFRAGDH